MIPDTLEQVAAEIGRERRERAEHARLVAQSRLRRVRAATPRFSETIVHLLAAQRRPVTR